MKTQGKIPRNLWVSDYQMIRVKDIRTSGYQNAFTTLISCYPDSHYLIPCCPDEHKHTGGEGSAVHRSAYIKINRGFGRATARFILQ